MSHVKISKYVLQWHHDLNNGKVHLIDINGYDHHINVQTIQELAAFGDILRNEQPIMYNSHYLQTGEEPVGENE